MLSTFSLCLVKVVRALLLGNWEFMDIMAKITTDDNIVAVKPLNTDSVKVYWQ